MPSLPSNGEIHLLNVPNTYLLRDIRGVGFFYRFATLISCSICLQWKSWSKYCIFWQDHGTWIKSSVYTNFVFLCRKNTIGRNYFGKSILFFHKPLWFSTNVFNFQHSILIHAYYEFWNRKWEYHFKGDFMMHNLD